MRIRLIALFARLVATNTRFVTGSALSALVAIPNDPCNGGPTVATVTLGN